MNVKQKGNNMNEMTGKEKKAQRRKNKENLKGYYVQVIRVNPKNEKDHVSYPKLVTTQKAAEMIYGKMDRLGKVSKNLKHEWKLYA